MKKIREQLNEVLNILNNIILSNINEETSSDERHIRELIADEHTAVRKYEEFATLALNDKVRKALNDIASEELVHIGELEQLLKSIGMSTEDSYKEGAKEIKDLLNEEVESKGTNSDLIEILRQNKTVGELLKWALDRYYPDKEEAPIPEEIREGNVRIGKDYTDIASILSNKITKKYEEPLKPDLSNLGKTIDKSRYISPNRVVVELYELACSNVNNDMYKMEQDKNNAYTERNKLVAFLSKLYPSCLGRHEETDTGWDREWMTIVYVHSPEGQLSWHIHDSEIHLFNHLNYNLNIMWDGHTTEEKYNRLLNINHLSKIEEEVSSKEIKKGLSKQGFKKDFKSCSLGQDKDGYFVYTHRARSKSYEHPDSIPLKDINFIDSTG
jgi:rubrerythrin